MASTKDHNSDLTRKVISARTYLRVVGSTLTAVVSKLLCEDGWCSAPRVHMCAPRACAREKVLACLVGTGLI